MYDRLGSYLGHTGKSNDHLFMTVCVGEGEDILMKQLKREEFDLKFSECK